MTDQLHERFEEQPDGLLAKWHPMDQVAAFQVKSSLPMMTEADRGKLLDIIESESLRGGDIIGCEFLYSDYVIHPVQLASEETGEIVDAVRIVFPQPEGPPIAFVSLGVLKSLDRIAWKVGRVPPYYPPVRVKLKQVNTRGAKRTYKLVLVEE